MKQLGWISKELLSEKSQSQKVTYHMIPFISHSQTDKIIEIKNRLVVVRISGGGGHTREVGDDYKKGHMRSPYGDRNTLYIDCLIVNILVVILS